MTKKRARRKFTINEIGIIHSPYKSLREIPCQGIRSGTHGKVEVYPEYTQGLRDIEGFSHIIVLYRFHKAKRYRLLARPFLDNQLHGIFSIRGPWRPNYIGMSTVKLIKRRGNILEVSNVDVLDGTPLLDIKPYVPQFDERKGARFGWLQGRL